jgi:hypothetical protein
MAETTLLPFEKVQGIESWLLTSRNTEAAVTQIGGMVGPVTFKLGSKRITPYSVAPWFQEQIDPSTPAILRVLRGDFFCAPFGGNDKPLGKEKFPCHGESANNAWELTGSQSSSKETSAEFVLRTSIRKGEIRKVVRLISGQTVVYQRHTLTGFTGPMPMGHHAMLKFPDEPMSGLVSTSPFVYGQVFPGAFENPAMHGYQSLKPGATFRTLCQVPMIDGNMADLSHYPVRPGFEDLVMVVTNPKTRLGWNAVVFQREGYVWFALKDTRVLRNTVLWISNGGRHYAPWSGRHSHVLGIEDVTAYFHYGINESTGPNPLSREGMPTAIELKPETATVVNYIAGVAAVPLGFERVASIKPAEDGKSIIITSTAGHEVQTPVDLGWLGL